MGIDSLFPLKLWSMSESHPPEFGINSWLEDELYQEYLHDRRDGRRKLEKGIRVQRRGTPPTAATARKLPTPFPCWIARLETLPVPRFRNISPLPAKPWSLCAAPPPASPRT